MLGLYMDVVMPSGSFTEGGGAMEAPLSEEVEEEGWGPKCLGSLIILGTPVRAPHVNKVGDAAFLQASPCCLYPRRGGGDGAALVSIWS